MPAVSALVLFLSTLSLRRATRGLLGRAKSGVFLSTLSLRRATFATFCDILNMSFLSTLSLRRATSRRQRACASWCISIHALLAESDLGTAGPIYDGRAISIHALLAESDILTIPKPAIHGHFYPRSPCGERHTNTDVKE